MSVKKLTLFVILLCAACNLVAQETKSPWPHIDTDLKVDPNVKWGSLPNGLRYAILKNQHPPERVSLRLFVDAGSLMEKDSQQGLAHFLEHMAFNGTKNFPPGEMVEYFQRLGMAFGADTNAHTNFDETVYKLELPKADPELLEKSFLLLRDYTDGMLLLEEEIEKERGIILSEKLTRDSPSNRTFLEGLHFSLPESLISNRLPIGKANIIKTASRADFIDFYRNWYIAPKMAIVAVGDFDPQKIETLITKHFDSLPIPTTSPQEPDLGKVSNGRGLIAKLHIEPDMPYTKISIEQVNKISFEKDISQVRRRKLVEAIVSQMVNRRFEIIAKKEDSPILEGALNQGRWLDFIQSSEISLSCNPENWEKALTLGEQELRRCLVYGFTESEFTEAKQKLVARAEVAAQRSPTRKSKQLSSEIVNHLSKNTVFVNPNDSLTRIQSTIQKITLDEPLASFRERWQGADRTIFIGGNVEPVESPDKTIINVWNESKTVRVDPPKESVTKEFAYQNFGTPSTHSEKNYEKTLEITQLTYPNQVRVNLKKTDFETDTIYLNARFGHGKSSEPEDKPGLTLFGNSILSQIGLENHSYDELERIFAGKKVSAQFYISDDSFQISGRTRNENLEEQLNLMTSYIKYPGWRTDGITQFKNSIDSTYLGAQSTDQGVMSDKTTKWLHGGDSRFGLPQKELLKNYTIDDVKNWIKPALKKDSLELSIVGDFDDEKILSFLSKTFGTLQTRESLTSNKRVNINFPAKGETKEFPFSSKIERALVVTGWKTTDMDNINETRRLYILSSIIRDRLRLEFREKLGDTYSPYATHQPSDVWEDYGAILCYLQIKPERIKEVMPILKKIATDLTNDGISDDELSRALTPTIEQLKQTKRNNRYWLSQVLSGSTEKPRKLDWAKSMENDYQNIKKDEIDLLVKKYINPENLVTAIILPNKN